MEEKSIKPAKDPNESAGPARKSVMLELATHRILDKSAKNFKLTNGEYASAAIAFFAESGLDPTAERAAGLAGVNAVVEVETLRVRTQNMNIGNRLISIIRGWEKSLYGFQQQQQMSTNTYLELIESNVLRHQVALETKLLGPMVEQLFRVNQEVSTIRGLASLLLVKVYEKPHTDFAKNKKEMDDERDAELTSLLREFIKTNTVPTPQPTTKPAVTPIPPRPVAPVPPAPAAPTP